MASSIRAPHSSLLSTTSEEAYRPIREPIEKPILSGSYILLARRRWSANATWAGKDSRCKSICYIKTALYSSKKKYKIIYRPEKKLEITFDLFSAWTSPGLQDKDADLYSHNSRVLAFDYPSVERANARSLELLSICLAFAARGITEANMTVSKILHTQRGQIMPDQRVTFFLYKGGARCGLMIQNSQQELSTTGTRVTSARLQMG